jgi:hypothetical protein
VNDRMQNYGGVRLDNITGVCADHARSLLRHTSVLRREI